MTYADAVTECASIGKTLPIVNSAGDVALVSQYTDTWVGNQCSVSNPTYWGSEYLSNESPNAASNNGNWNSGEPNSNCDTEQCLEVRSDGLWNDKSCTSSR